MSHQVLARKWRPRTFETLVGQDHVVRALDHALKTGRLHHAYLFTGTRGVGKTTIARILAKAVNCEQGMSPTPCGECNACTEIDVGRFVDYLELDAASNRGVDEMAQLLDNAVYAPTAGRYKVYVIDEVHMLTAHAFNAMLKTLEEPPPHVLFILATTDPQKVPVTVLSRCMQLNLRNMHAPAIAGHLQTILTAEDIPFDEAALPLIGRAAAGSMRDSLSLLDQAIAYGAGEVRQTQVREMLGTVDADHLERVFAALAERDAQALVTIADEVADQNAGADSLLSELAQAVSEMAVAGQASAAVEPGSVVEKWAQSFADHDLQVFYQILIYARRDLPLAPDVRSGLTMALLRLVAFSLDEASSGNGSPGPGAVSRQRSSGVPGSEAGSRLAKVDDARPSVATQASGDSSNTGSSQTQSDRSASNQGASNQAPATGTARSPAAAARAALAGNADATSGRSRAPDASSVDSNGSALHTPAPRRSSALRAALAASGTQASTPEPVSGNAEQVVPMETSRASDQVPVPAPTQAANDQDERWLEEAANESDPLVNSSTLVQADQTQTDQTQPSTSASTRQHHETDWPSLAVALKLGGRLGQFMRQSECTGIADDTYCLTVPIAPLADPAVIGKAQQAVSEYLGRAVTFDVTVGAVQGDTAVGRDHADQQVRLAQARETIESDPFVQTLLDEFDGQIVPDSIRPLDSEPTQHSR
ncbi:MAG: DNA polymerase III subunit gamma/tau [Burkholderiaceae bacterium]